MTTKTPMRADAIIASIETYLSNQYNERHVQMVPVVRRGDWLDRAAQFVYDILWGWIAIIRRGE